MELREWLIILGLVLVTIIVIDGVRRLQRQRKVPRLDQVERGEDAGSDAVADPEEAAREEQINWELPNGGARVVKPASSATVAPKPKLQRQEHPGPSKVFSRMAQERDVDEEAERETPARDEPVRAKGGQAARPARPVPARDEDEAAQAEAPSSGRFTRASMTAAFRSAFQRHDEEAQSAHREPSLGEAAQDMPAADEPRLGARGAEPRYAASDVDSPDEYSDELAEFAAGTPDEDEPALQDDVVTPHPVVEKARRHNVSAQRARETLAHAEEVIVISVLARNEEGFSGTQLLDLMLACGLRYSEMGIFLRYETEAADSELQFAMVDVVKPGTFDLEAMDEFSTPGVTFLMPLPGAQDSAAAFEAMFETAMVLVRNLGGELKDENRSVMTAQTVEFARQRVQDFERRHRLHRYQAN